MDIEFKELNNSHYLGIIANPDVYIQGSYVKGTGIPKQECNAAAYYPDMNISKSASLVAQHIEKILYRSRSTLNVFKYFLIQEKMYFTPRALGIINSQQTQDLFNTFVCNCNGECNDQCVSKENCVSCDLHHHKYYNCGNKILYATMCQKEASNYQPLLIKRKGVVGYGVYYRGSEFLQSQEEIGVIMGKYNYSNENNGIYSCVRISDYLNQFNNLQLKKYAAQFSVIPTNFARYLNPDCHDDYNASIKIIFVDHIPVLIVYATRTINPGEEIKVQMMESTKQNNLGCSCTKIECFRPIFEETWDKYMQLSMEEQRQVAAVLNQNANNWQWLCNQLCDDVMHTLSFANIYFNVADILNEYNTGYLEFFQSVENIIPYFLGVLSYNHYLLKLDKNTLMNNTSTAAQFKLYSEYLNQRYQSVTLPQSFAWFERCCFCIQKQQILKCSYLNFTQQNKEKTKGQRDQYYFTVIPLKLISTMKESITKTFEKHTQITENQVLEAYYRQFFYEQSQYLIHDDEIGFFIQFINFQLQFNHDRQNNVIIIETELKKQLNNQQQIDLIEQFQKHQGYPVSLRTTFHNLLQTKLPIQEEIQAQLPPQVNHAHIIIKGKVQEREEEIVDEKIIQLDVKVPSQHNKQADTQKIQTILLNNNNARNVQEFNQIKEQIVLSDNQISISNSNQQKLTQHVCNINSQHSENQLMINNAESDFRQSKNFVSISDSTQKKQSNQLSQLQESKTRVDDFEKKKTINENNCQQSNNSSLSQKTTKSATAVVSPIHTIERNQKNYQETQCQRQQIQKIQKEIKKQLDFQPVETPEMKEVIIKITTEKQEACKILEFLNGFIGDGATSWEIK